MPSLRLGVNIDHVATLRQARGGHHPVPLMAAKEAVLGGADSITVHLREDRRHIQETDVREIKKKLNIPLNLEMALHAEIIRIAFSVKPEHVCLVPEKRQELTTEGGLNLLPKKKQLQNLIPRFQRNKTHVSLFIDPAPKQIQLAALLKADAIELHTGTYANAQGSRKKREYDRLKKAARLAKSLGLHVHAGHGLDYQNTIPVCRISEIEELNIGHSIICYAVFVGMKKAVKEMRVLMNRSRKR